MASNRCTTIETFSNWVEAKADLQAEILAKVSNKEVNNTPELCALKQAWREAETANQCGLKRAAEPAPEVEIDAPLDTKVFQA